jgi:hypothetical protein
MILLTVGCWDCTELVSSQKDCREFQAPASLDDSMLGFQLSGGPALSKHRVKNENV